MKKNNFRVSGSFRDPSGFLFVRDGTLFRQVNQVYRQHYDRLIDSGLYDALVEEGLLISHEDVALEPVDPGEAYKVIRPAPVTFISYPYEWSFSQLQDAALTTMRIQKKAIDFGMTLKDSSAYNIQFDRGRAKLIDTLSFEVYREGEPWIAYRQFCQHFLAPLALMAHRDVRLGQMSRIFIDGPPLNLASRLLPLRTRLNFSLLTHIHLHARAQERYADRPIDRNAIDRRKMARVAFLGLMDNLEASVRNLQWAPARTEWADYYSQHKYADATLTQKKGLVETYLDHIEPRSLWDLGANIGVFSRLASDRQVPTVAFDIDPAAVDRNYRMVRAKGESYLLPLLIDLTNPSPGLGWHHIERLSLLERSTADTVMALALVHHLAISNNLSLGQIASFFSSIGRWLLVEFVPKSDSQVQRLLRTREDIFPDYHVEGFEKAFERFYRIRRCDVLEQSERRMYLMERV